MHILHIPAWYKTPDFPLMGNFFEEQIRAIGRRGHRNGVIFPEYTFSYRAKTDSYALKEPVIYDDEGITTLHFKTKPSLPVKYFNTINMKIFKKRVLENLEKYLQIAGKPDIIHAHGVYMGGISARIISEKLKIPFVNTEQFSGLIVGNLHQNAAFKKELYQTFQKVSKFITCSTAFRNQLMNKYDFAESKFELIPNMVKDDFFENPKPAPPIDTFHFLCIGYLNKNKNHQLLFEAFAKLKKKYANISLKLVGGGALKAELLDLARSLEINQEVDFLGNISRAAVKKQIDLCHVVISTSRIETFGINLIEALACGRPIIATNSGGPSDTVKPNLGILVEEHSPTEVALAMENLLVNYEDYPSDELRKHCRKSYKEEVIAERIELLYKRVISEKKAFN